MPKCRRYVGPPTPHTSLKMHNYPNIARNIKQCLVPALALALLASCGSVLGDGLLVGDFMAEYDALEASGQMGRAVNEQAMYRRLAEKGRAIISGNPERMKAMQATSPGLYRDFLRRYRNCVKRAGDNNGMQQST